MDAPTTEDVRSSLEPLDLLQQKIVAGLFTVMIQNPQQVKDREWMAEQVTQMTLLAGEFAADTPQDGVGAVQTYLQDHAARCLSAALLLFQRVGIDMAPRAEAGFSLDDALEQGLTYLPSLRDLKTPKERDLGEQPLARLMRARELKPADLVVASKEQITHKMVARAMKGRRLTANTMDKVQRAWQQATQEECARSALFNYKP
ncbi:MAG: hypothetical protein O2816_18240 [Planctomycetota bacterium]|nr:hypothetical protein [Planctomycetota bacterium]